MNLKNDPLYSFLWDYLKKYRLYFFTAIFLALPYSGIKGIQVYLVKSIVDTLSVHAKAADAWKMSIFLLGLGLLNYPIRFYHFYLMRYVIDKVSCDIRSSIYSRLQNLSLEQFNKEKAGNLVSQLLNDSQTLTQGARNFVDIIREPLTALVMLIMALVADVYLTFIVILITPLFILIFHKSGKKVRLNQDQVQRELAMMTHNACEGLYAQKITKSFNLQNYIVERFDKSQDNFFSYQMLMAKVEENAHPLVELIGSLAFSLVILFAYYRIQSGTTTTGDFFSFITALALMMDPLRKYSAANVKMNQSRAAGSRLLDLMKIPQERKNGISETEKKTFDDCLEIKDLSFQIGEKVILDTINIKIKKGSRIAFVGASGSGKSTLINLLLGLYSPTKGNIFLDGINYEQLSLKAIRNFFGYVGQEVILFHDTLEENITLGRINTQEDFLKSLERAHLKSFVSQLPQGVQTLIGDRGSTMSGGQGQRITIARAMLTNPPIVLLDEATSGLDTQSENMVQSALDEFCQSKEKTIVSVAHRLYTIKDYDYIYFFDHGKILEQGTHEELMALKKQYYWMFSQGK